MKNGIKKTIYGIILAIVANLIILIIAKPLFPAPEAFGPYTYSAVISLTALGMIAAAIGYYLMTICWKKTCPTRDINKDYTIIAYILMVLSFIPDILLPYSTEADDIGATWPIVGVLILMHIASAFIAIKIFTKK